MTFEKKQRNKINLKSICLNKLMRLIAEKKKILKVDVIYFDEPINGVEYVKYNMFYIKGLYSQIGFNLKGHTIYSMIKALEYNEVYSYTRYEGKNYKIRAKK